MQRRASSMVKKLYLTRHAQAEHNVASDWSIPDAKLTPLGQKQSRELNDLTKDTFQRTAQLIVCSPLLRPMETMLLGYPSLMKRLEGEGKPVIITDLLQEVNSTPCDVPTYPPSAIKEALGGIFKDLDFSGLGEGYATKKGIWDPANVEERCRKVRKMLNEREEEEIVVVAHGDILRQLVDGDGSRRPWGNAEVKIFTFSEGSHDLVEVADVDPESETAGPTSGGM